MTSSLFSSRSRSINEDKKWFVAIIVVLLIGFLTVVTASLLWLFVEENKITRTLSSGIATQYGSEWALEYALLKKKNHDHWFEDELVRNDSCGISKALQSSSGSIDVMSKSLKVGYKMESQVTSWSGVISGGWYEIIPLYTDNGVTSLLSVCSWLKKLSGEDTTKFTKDFTLNLSWAGNPDNLSWNILVSSGSDTIGLAGTGGITGSFSSGALRTLNGTSWEQYVKDSPETISNFLSWSIYTKPFLILFNNQSDSIEYNLTSTSVGVSSVPVPFSSPKPCIYATAEIGRGSNSRGQFYKFCQNNSDLLDGLKYSVFSK